MNPVNWKGDPLITVFWQDPTYNHSVILQKGEAERQPMIDEFNKVSNGKGTSEQNGASLLGAESVHPDFHIQLAFLRLFSEQKNKNKKTKKSFKFGRNTGHTSKFNMLRVGCHLGAW